jgi:hypothetical protein
VHWAHADESPEEVDYYDYDMGLPPGCVETDAGAPSPGPALALAGAPLPDGMFPVSLVLRSILCRGGFAVGFQQSCTVHEVSNWFRCISSLCRMSPLRSFPPSIVTGPMYLSGRQVRGNGREKRPNWGCGIEATPFLEDIWSKARKHG